MLHAFRNAMKVVPKEYAGHEQFLIIGPARDGQLLSWSFPTMSRRESSTRWTCGRSSTVTSSEAAGRRDVPAERVNRGE
jgi:hypothetical protein